MTTRQYKHPQINLRIPAELKAEIEKATKTSHRSMNAEIITRLQESFTKSNDDYLVLADLIRSIIKEELSKLKQS